MEYRFFRLFFALVLGILVAPAALPAQVGNLSGTVNTYLDVTAIDMTLNTVTLNSVAGLALGDTILLIQMQGATMNTANAATFGDVTAINTAGKFEFNVVCRITGNVVMLERMMLNPYNPAGGLQVVDVADIYDRVNVTGTITAQPWDGNVGGVVVIMAPKGIVSLGANIDVNGRGFRGAARQDMVSGCSCGNFSVLYQNFFYPSNDWHGALKAEGIAPFSIGMESGKGKQVNGGGGGNDHNTGGAGGGNYGNGGNGGNASASSCFFGNYCRGLDPGLGGLGLSATYYNGVEQRLFLGGGGGAGHYGNAAVGGGSAGGDGERGAGIVIIWADSLIGNGFSINANGNTIGPISAADGGGGGGAGGVVVLDVRAFAPSSLLAQARGGNGANHSWGAGANNCKGTGGGGGGGVVWLRGLVNPPSISTNVSGGIAGVQGGGSCSSLGNAGSTNGVAGAILTGFARPISGVTNINCTGLPILMAYFKAEKAGSTAVRLLWQTTTETDNLRFDIERAIDGVSFESIGYVGSLSQRGQGATYQWLDNAPAAGMNWYRLRQRDLDGRSSVSEVVSVMFDGVPTLAIKNLYPNPVNSPEELILELTAPAAQAATVTLTDIVGKSIYAVSLNLEEGFNAFRLPTQGMSKGIYFLKVSGGKYGETVRKVKVN
jgi:Secretion system C-terminal sorting domain